MSNLIAVAYDDVATANTVREKLFELQKQNLITLADAAVAERTMDGKIKLHQSTSTTGIGAAGGALWGGLIGLIFLMPLIGMAVGAATGAAAGAMTDVGVDDKFMKKIGEELKPGAAALFVLVTQSTPDKVIPQIAPFGGKIIHTSLSNQAEENLRQALAGARG
ncbi:DUF1269 domain-containing protein [Microtetraspora sp. AC03309]|uniref:DUF1269 domain-containing protein n=1 Tax=Microtetraspora sp. AC03309 TaxID=2779376 RepID=UPI001E30F553|nr:DUF1269 domain-containing protein [Microtetraspora sp. AC03309]MCC5577935.1 DUF1269 domain-containing protein [Microtetraspora sp. AC03309]